MKLKGGWYMTVSENEDREYRSTLVKIGKKGEEPVK